MQPLVPGFIITAELSSVVTGSTWSAVRSVDDHRFILKVVSVADVTWTQAQAARQIAVHDRIENEHLVRLHDVIALADGTLALVQDEVTGGSLAQVLGARGQLTPGETVTTLAPLFGALAELHAGGVVHGAIAPANVVFSADGRPLISDLGVDRLLGQHFTPLDGSSGFMAPELVGGATPSPPADVYAMAALGWLCLAGVPPALEAGRPSLAVLRPDAPAGLVEVLTSCLSPDPGERPAADTAAVEVFEAATAEPVALGTCDPADEITRRIRAAAVSAAVGPPPVRKWHRAPLVIAIAAIVVASALGGATWSLLRPPGTLRPDAVAASAPPATTPSKPTTPRTPEPKPPLPTPDVKAMTTPVAAASSPAGRGATPLSVTDVVTAPESPRRATTGLLQGLVDARALSYLSRDSALLDLAYAPGASKAGADRANIAVALKNGATYLGLAFVVRDAAFLDGTSETARISATIVTPAYRTGQPDGRKVAHLQEAVGPSVFSLRLTRDGWRILSLTGP